jgi:alpha-beta hydrolase superfamily lysophospholipase
MSFPSWFRSLSRRSRWLIAAVPVLLLAAFGWFLDATTRTALEPWLGERLSAEFTVERLDEVATFDDYLALEDELFAQLQDKVYAHTKSGPGYELYRYAKGSAADPQVRKPNWNRSFELSVVKPLGAVLLLHGMSDSPYSLRAIAEALQRKGYWVLGLRMPGHGTAPSGLKYLSWQDAAAAVGLGVQHLQTRAGAVPLHLVGYSTGAALALNYALDAQEGVASPVPASLVLISPSIRIHAVAALAAFKDRIGKLPGLGGLSWLQIEAEFDPYKYNSFATNAAAQVHRLTQRVSKRIATRAQSSASVILPPTLVFKSTVDATVLTEAVVDDLLARLKPRRHELVLFDINRFELKSALLVSDPGPLTARLMTDSSLPFAMSLVTNENARSTAVVSRRKEAFSNEVTRTRALGLHWPNGVISLSHVALPFPPDDPLYGQRPPTSEGVLYLGDLAIRGERGLMRIPTDWLIRLRHNPFYDYLQTRTLDWIGDAGR